MFNGARAFVEDPTLDERSLSRNKAIFYSSLTKLYTCYKFNVSQLLLVLF